MKAIVAGQNDGDPVAGTLLNQWLTSADLEDISDLATAEHPADDGAAHDRLSEGNVVRQLHNLMTYPSVRTAVDDGRVHLIGMHFDTTTGNVRFLEDIAPGGVTTDRELPDGRRFVRRSSGAQLSRADERA